MNWKDIVERTAKTLVEVFLGAFTVNQLVAGDIAAAKVAAVAAVAAGFSVIWNAILQWSAS